MSARATRGPDAGTVGMAVAGRFGVAAMVASRATDFRGLGAPCCTNHNRNDSSEIFTPIEASDPTIMRTEVPAFRSFMSTALNGSSMAALVVLLALAVAISAASLRASSGCCVGIYWENTGDALGKAKGNTNAPLGKNLSAKRLDVGVSLKNRNGHADYPSL